MSDYFAADAPRAADAQPRWLEIGELETVQFAEGLTFRPVLGKDALVNWVSYEPGTVVPVHSHVEEQFTFVLEGEFEFECDGEKRILRPGSVVHIPAGVPHGARTYETTCLQVDVFSPPRKVLVEAMRDQLE
jgi:quercetin dioxygenase-like cupin family protein